MDERNEQQMDEQEPLPGDEPVAEEDFTDAETARDHEEMDDAEAEPAAERNDAAEGALAEPAPQPVAPPPAPPVSGVAPVDPPREDLSMRPPHETGSAQNEESQQDGEENPA